MEARHIEWSDEDSDGLDRDAVWRNSSHRREFGLPVEVVWEGSVIPATTMALTPEGLSVVVFPEVCKVTPPIGAAVVVNLHLPHGEKSHDLNAVVADTYASRFQERGVIRLDLGLVRESRTGTQLRGDQRKRKRFLCPPELRPVAHCEDPLFFQQYLHLQMIDLGRDGAGFVTKSEQTTLIEGQLLNLHIYMPMIGMIFASLRVENVTKRPCGNGYRVGTRFRRMPESAMAAITEYLLIVHEGLTIDELVKQGFPVQSVEESLSFCYAATFAQLKEVLELRLRAAHAAGWRLRSDDANDMLDPYDRFARQLCHVSGEHVVAAGRIVFNDGIPDRSEHLGCGVELPEWLWREGFVEASRFCTEPGVLRDDLLRRLVSQVGRTAVQAGFRHVVLSSGEEDLPVLTNLGAEPLGQRFLTPYQDDVTFHVMLLDARELVERARREETLQTTPKLSLWRRLVLGWRLVCSPRDALAELFFHRGHRGVR